jgi:hypothetical protein
MNPKETPEMARRAQTEKVHERIAADLPINSRVAKAIVDDPYSNNGEKIEVLRSVRNDPLADMLSRRVIDQAQFNAGRYWQALHERSTIGAVGAIDPGKEAVDGGKMRDPITDSQIKAFRELAKAEKLLGHWGSALMQDLLADQMSMNAMCRKYECTTGRQMNFLSLRLRECLEDLGKLWGFVA